MVAYSVWRRKRDTRKLVYRRVLNDHQALMIKTGTRSGGRVVVSADMAEQVKSRKSNQASARPR